MPARVRREQRRPAQDRASMSRRERVPLAAGAETFIGRYDAATGIHPDIDLKPVDTDRSISRRHAKIVQHDNRYFVVEEIGTTNGTFVNRRRVEKGTEVEFRDGDEVQFGLVKTVFRNG
jgi:pSer/pThr/pTyr-binding forkhead associated (FHA) protein